MISFTVYDSATGEISRTGICQDGMLAAQAGAGETAIEGTFDGNSEYLPGGVATARPAMPALTVTGQTLGFASTPPAGTVLTVWDSIYPDPVEITASDVHLAVPVTAGFSIDPPWPYVGAKVEMDGSASTAPSGAQVVEPNMAAVRAGMSLTVVQLMIGLVAAGWITEAEGEAWLSGSALPASAVAVIGTLPTEAQFAAKARMLRMTSVARTDDLVDVLAAAVGKTATEVDTFFATYAAV